MGNSRYICNKNFKSFKIEFSTRKQADKFLNQASINIGGIRLLHSNREREVNPCIPQCWGCGHINTNHSLTACPEYVNQQMLCLRCGTRGHRFYDCHIPKDIQSMTQQHKDARFCIPCNTRGNHTSLDHTLCNTKRNIIKNRIKAMRDEREKTNKETDRDINLIKNVIEQTQTVQSTMLAHPRQAEILQLLPLLY